MVTKYTTGQAILVPAVISRPEKLMDRLFIRWTQTDFGMVFLRQMSLWTIRQQPGLNLTMP